MSEEFDQLLSEVREDASALKEYLSRTGTAAERLEGADAAVHAAEQTLGSVAEGITKLSEQVGDLAQQIQRMDPASVRDALTRLDERVRSVETTAEQISRMQLAKQLGVVQARVGQLTKWVVALWLLTAAYVVYLLVRLSYLA